MAIFVVQTGRAIASGLVGAITALVPKWIQWGTGAGTAAAADPGLFTAATEARVACTASQATTTTTNDTLQFVGTLTSTSGQTITNVGLWDAAGTGSPATGGNFFLHGDHGGQLLAVGDAITYTIKIQYS